MQSSSRFAELLADGPLNPPQDTVAMPLEDESPAVREDLDRAASR